jgi:hypothetical protein
VVVGNKHGNEGDVRARQAATTFFASTTKLQCKVANWRPARRVNSPPRPPFRCLYLSAKGIHIYIYI